VSNTVDGLKKKANDVANEPSVRRTLDFIKKHVMKATKFAKEKLDEVSADPKIQNAASKVSDFAVKVQDGTKAVVKNVDDLVNRPDVQERIAQVRTTTADTINKSVEAVKNLIDKKDNTEE
jgi:hypothetical protein